MSYEYLESDVTPNVPFPLVPGWGIFHDVFGHQRMRGPMRLQPGRVNAPSLTFENDNRTGIFSPDPFSIGYAIFGFLRFLVSDQGVRFLNESGIGASFSVNNLTQNRTYVFPDDSGTLLLEENATFNDVELTNLSGGSVGPGRAVTAVSGGFDLAEPGDVAVGVITETIANGASGKVRVSGPFTQADWTAVVGVASLTPGELYSVATGGTAAIGQTNIIFQAVSEDTIKVLGAGSSSGVDFIETFTTVTPNENTFTLTGGNAIPATVKVHYNGVWQPDGFEAFADRVEVQHELPAACKIDVSGRRA